jgi:hypothetical protein
VIGACSYSVKTRGILEVDERILPPNGYLIIVLCSATSSYRNDRYLANSKLNASVHTFPRLFTCSPITWSSELRSNSCGDLLDISDYQSPRWCPAQFVLFHVRSFPLCVTASTTILTKALRERQTARMVSRKPCIKNLLG